MSDKELILVVDDDPDLVDMVATKLEANNYRTARRTMASRPGSRSGRRSPPW